MPDQLPQTEVPALQAIIQSLGWTGPLPQTEVPCLQAIYVLLASGAGGGGSLPDQTGHAGEVLGTDGTTASWQPVVAGPALPVWTYTTGVPGTGQFTADQNNPTGTTSLTFSEQSKYGATSFTNLFSNHMFTGATVYMTDASGVSCVFQLISNGSAGTFLVETLAVDATAVWQGDYQVFFIPPTNQAEAANASGLSTFTGNIGTPNTLDINTGVITNAT